MKMIFNDQLLCQGFNGSTGDIGDIGDKGINGSVGEKVIHLLINSYTNDHFSRE